MHGYEHKSLKLGIIVRLLKQFVGSVGAIEGVISNFTRGLGARQSTGSAKAFALIQ